jgi:glucosamine-6-phosphate isomerase
MKVFDTEIKAALYCEKTLINIVENNPSTLICLAAGHTSLALFKRLIQSEKAGKVDFSNVKIVGLDEWVGLSGDDDGSCENFLRKNLFDHIGVIKSNIRLFDGKAHDLKQECENIEAFISKNGGIDYMLLGVGMNGHLGLNEPGISEDSTAGVVMLDAVTKAVADKYFIEKPELTGGVTLGIKNILQVKKVQVLITGERKKDIVKKIVLSKKTNTIPATLIKDQENVEFILDKHAASLL